MRTCLLFAAMRPVVVATVLVFCAYGIQLTNSCGGNAGGSYSRLCPCGNGSRSHHDAQLQSAADRSIINLDGYGISQILMGRFHY